jgi:hypothetical protein
MRGEKKADRKDSNSKPKPLESRAQDQFHACPGCERKRKKTSATVIEGDRDITCVNSGMVLDEW